MAVLIGTLFAQVFLLICSVEWSSVCAGIRVTAESILHTNYRSLAEAEKALQSEEDAAGADAMQASQAPVLLLMMKPPEPKTMFKYRSAMACRHGLKDGGVWHDFVGGYCHASCSSIHCWLGVLQIPFHLYHQCSLHALTTYCYYIVVILLFLRQKAREAKTSGITSPLQRSTAHAGKDQ
jgi:hypothetical protein